MINKIKLTFPEGKSAEFETAITADKVISEHLKKQSEKAVAAKLNDKIIDFHMPIEESGDFNAITTDSQEGLDVIRHSSSHVMALAIKKHFPNCKITIGPAVEDGFYYDFDDLDIKEEDFPKIEDEIKKILHDKLKFSREVLTRVQALKKFSSEPYKIELINEFPDGEIISAYTVGEFTDLCRGPHVLNAGKIGAIKIMKLAGAYWRGDSKNKMLTRVYGTAFTEKKQLQEYLTKLEEAKKRDHRKIGKELDLFSFHEYSPGSPFFHGRGAILYNGLLNFIRKEYFKRGYQEVITPLLYDQALWEASGHWEHFKEDMFILDVDNRKFALKPMNCPSHCLIYLNGIKSYRNLPLRIADFAPLHRNELKGVLSGLTRVRKFCQDDAHIFCTLEQVEGEVNELFDFIKCIYTDTFQMELRVSLGTRPEKSLGTREVWESAELALKSSLENKNISYQANLGGGAFYGPKIDFLSKDSLDREWQLATIQLDFNLPERFNLEYEGKDGRRHRPVMIHRALFGSLERFIGVLIEHFAGKFPPWLNPVQIKVLPITDKHSEYALSVAKKLKSKGLRVEVDERSESTNRKVRDAQLEKVNYVLVVGDKEVAEDSVNVRLRSGLVKGVMSLSDFAKMALKEVEDKVIS